MQILKQWAKNAIKFKMSNNGVMKRFATFFFVFTFFYLLPNSKSVHAATYTGRYTSGLVVSENNAVVDGADISNSGSGTCLRITGDNVTVKNSKIHNCQDHGVIFLGTNGGLFENNEIYQAAMRNPPNTTSGGWPSLLKVQSVDESTSGLSHHIVIRNNYIHEGYGECMGLRGSYITVTGNHVKDCYSIGIYSNSDHTTVTNNFVECSGNTHYNRDGLPMSGIGFAEETFSNWGAHGHDSQTVLRNTVSGCKYGFRYGNSANNMGLVNTEVAFNTFAGIKTSPVSITHYPNESNINIHDNTILPNPISSPPPNSFVPGDITGDGHVNEADFVKIKVNFGRPYTIFDYNLIVANWGR